MTSMESLSDANLRMFLDNLVRATLWGIDNPDHVRGAKGTPAGEMAKVSLGMALPFLAEHKRRGFSHPLDHILTIERAK